VSWLLVTQDFPPGFDGGIASWTLDLAHALHGAGETVTVLARSTKDTAAHDEALPFPVVRMRGRSWGNWQGLWALIAGLSRRGDRIICATWGLSTGLRRLPGVRLAVAFHGSDLTRLSQVPPPQRAVLDASTALLPNSRFMADLLERLSGGPDPRVRVLPMPLQVSLPLQVKRPETLEPASPRAGLVCLARLTPLKGVDRAIRLAAALGVPLTIIGDGPARSSLEELAASELAAQADWGGARFTGRLPRDAALATLVGARAAVLLPRADADGSGAEGLGLCLLEAAARGVPVIGCATGGVPEAVGPGLLLADPDRPDLDAVRRLLDDPDVGARARAWVQANHGPAAAVSVLRAALP